MKREVPLFREKLLAYCGLYCGQCSFKAAHDEGNPKHLAQLPFPFELKELSAYNCECCKGRCICGPCKIKPCAEAKGVGNCGECDAFPCGHITAFEKDGMPHHRWAVENLRAIRERGAEAWFRELAPAFSCRRCQSKQSWYYTCGCEGESAD